MAREWTERHIRELVRQEMKGFEKDGYPRLEPAWTFPETSEGYCPRYVEPIDTVKINGKTPFYDRNTRAPHYLDDDTKIRSLEYNVYKDQLGPTGTYKGQYKVMAIPINISMESIYFHQAWAMPCETYFTPSLYEEYPIYTRIWYPLTADPSHDPYTNRYPVFNMYVLQNGLIFGLEAHGNIVFRYMFDGSPVSLGTYLTLSDIQREMGKGWENIYSPISEYNWDTKVIHIAYSFTF